MNEGFHLLREISGPDTRVDYGVRHTFLDRASAMDYENAFLDRFKRLYGQYPSEGGAWRK